MHRSPAATARLGTAVLFLVVVFAATAVAVHFARPEYDGWHAPLSYYLAGPASAWLRGAYCGLSLGVVLLAAGLWCSLAPAARLQLVPVLFAAGGAALAVTAAWPGASPGYPVDDLGALIHGLSAMCSFLFVGVAMLLQSASLHRDPHWRPVAAPLLVLASLAFAGLWWHALDRSLPRGASQKAVIALYVLWLGTVAWRLRSAPVRAGAASPAEIRSARD